MAGCSTSPGSSSSEVRKTEKPAETAPQAAPAAPAEGAVSSPKVPEAARDAAAALKATSTVTTPAPPVRPPEFGGVVRAGAEAGKDAGQAITDAIRAQAPAAGQAGAQAGQSAGQGVGKGIDQEAPKVEEKARTLWERIKSIFAEPIKVSLDLDTGGVTTAAVRARSTYVSLSGWAVGGRSMGGLVRGRGRARIPETPDPGGASDEAFEAGYTGNDGRRAARSSMTAAGRENVASWLGFLQKAREEGGLGLDADKARAMVAMMQGESGLNLDPTARGD